MERVYEPNRPIAGALPSNGTDVVRSSPRAKRAAVPARLAFVLSGAFKRQVMETRVARPDVSALPRIRWP